jgi:hypothetical protein
MALGLAPRTFTPPTGIQPGDTPPELASSVLLGSLEVDHDEPDDHAGEGQKGRPGR